MTVFFMLVSGEHRHLPKAEVGAILEAEGLPFRMLEDSNRLLRLEAPPPAGLAVSKRSAFCRLCGVELLHCKASLGDILSSLQALGSEIGLNSGESFAVRVWRTGDSQSPLTGFEVEKAVGRVLLTMERDLRVDLRRPRKLFVGILSGRSFTFGLSVDGEGRKYFSSRTPRRKPFFHPSSLQPKIARCMVNLSRAAGGKILYDPFCGTGSILIEAGLMGLEALGGDLRKKMVKGTKVNLQHYGVENVHLTLANALAPPIRQVDAVSTDPPYGRAATTAGVPIPVLYRKFLEEIGLILKPQGYMCIAAPSTLPLEETAEEYGFKTVGRYSIYVHRSLTREIYVLRRM